MAAAAGTTTRASGTEAVRATFPGATFALTAGVRLALASSAEGAAVTVRLPPTVAAADFPEADFALAAGLTRTAGLALVRALPRVCTALATGLDDAAGRAGTFTGAFAFTGAFDFRGAFDVTSAFPLTGAVNFTGALAVTGAFALTTTFDPAGAAFAAGFPAAALRAGALAFRGPLAGLLDLAGFLPLAGAFTGDVAFNGALGEAGLTPADDFTLTPGALTARDAVLPTLDGAFEVTGLALPDAEAAGLAVFAPLAVLARACPSGLPFAAVGAVFLA